jgi:hypothetical protein
MKSPQRMRLTVCKTEQAENGTDAPPQIRGVQPLIAFFESIWISCG